MRKSLANIETLTTLPWSGGQGVPWIANKTIPLTDRVLLSEKMLQAGER